MAALLLSNAMLDVLFAAVVLRAERSRRENQLLAAAALLDAARDALLGLLVMHGVAISSALPMQICLVARILVLYPVLEFSYAFPTGRRPPSWLRLVAASAVLLATLYAVHPATSTWASHWAAVLLVFLPFFAGTVVVSRRNLAIIRRETTASGETQILMALAFRFAVGLITCVVVRPFFPAAVPAAFTFEGIVAVIAYGIVVNAVLRYRFFRVRGLVAEAVLYGGLSLCSLALVVMITDFISRSVQDNTLRSLCLAAAVLLPLAAWLLLAHYAPPLKALVLYPFDARRRRLKSILERVAQESLGVADAAAACELTSNAIASLSNGTVVLWRAERLGAAGWRSNISGPVLPQELAEYLQQSSVPSIHRRSFVEPALMQAFTMLGADALVVVRAQGNLLCAFAIKSRIIDQDLLDGAIVLAHNLGNKLAHLAMQEYASDLQTQLEASRRLTTLGSFVAAVAHDIRTPLTSVKMNLEMIRAGNRLDTELVDCADIALDELRRMNDYVSGMLDYVKPVQLRAVDFDVQCLIEETTRTLQPLLESRRLELRWDRPDVSPPLTVRADVSRLKQVLVNLLENAADASAPGNIIRIAAGPLERQRVAIRIWDQGHGIEPSNLDRIFEPFFTTREEGTGLGLAIVHKLVQAHDGEIRVDSQPGSGSTFTVILPACSAHSSSMVPRSMARAGRASRRSPPAA